MTCTVRQLDPYRLLWNLFGLIETRTDKPNPQWLLEVEAQIEAYLDTELPPNEPCVDCPCVCFVPEPTDVEVKSRPDTPRPARSRSREYDKR